MIIFVSNLNYQSEIWTLQYIFFIHLSTLQINDQGQHYLNKIDVE